ncbi:DUF3240 family protein [Helicobacter cappadocius]|uniref:DUF3240 family protein n=1 Tax=Helicobacter cappadocius TaxID=3063998 RepID=A0AA90PTI9_9HELI|nr:MULTISPECIES: DUF3240 family protein [unclassified Helicobacter]MDO7253291.1 DUF3240 family protein [Helicobacter sp. faydin-H75]MDP2539279.1 DUF3240 family protein [Helicobacter sp. faydin-H76]
MKLIEVYIDEQYKDNLVDLLLEDGFDDFYYFSCHKYAATSMLLSEKEQVSGRKDYGVFRLFVQEDISILLIQKLQKIFNKDQMRIVSYSSLSEI